MTAPSLRFSSCTDIVCDRQISVGAISSGNGNSVNSEGFVSLRSITYHEAEFSADRLPHVQDVPRSRSIDRTATQNNDRRNSIDISDPACYPPGRLNGKQDTTFFMVIHYISRCFPPAQILNWMKWPGCISYTGRRRSPTGVPIIMTFVDVNIQPCAALIYLKLIIMVSILPLDGDALLFQDDLNLSN